MIKIFIDPGHGGADPGAVGNGLKEKNLTLDIALKIRDMLAGYENVEVMLSREEDTTISLKQRIEMANAWCSDFLLSVHINAGGGTGYEDYIYYTNDSKTIAYQKILHEAIVAEVCNMKDRGMKKADFYVLRESKMPAFLSENGFIDNPNDVRKLKLPSFNELIARGHVNGLAKAFNLVKKTSVPDIKNPSVAHWAKIELDKAKKKGILIEDPNDKAWPEKNVTNAELAVILNRLRLLD